MSRASASGNTLRLRRVEVAQAERKREVFSRRTKLFLIASDVPDREGKINGALTMRGKKQPRVGKVSRKSERPKLTTWVVGGE